MKSSWVFYAVILVVIGILGIGVLMQPEAKAKPAIQFEEGVTQSGTRCAFALTQNGKAIALSCDFSNNKLGETNEPG